MRTIPNPPRHATPNNAQDTGLPSPADRKQEQVCNYYSSLHTNTARLPYNMAATTGVLNTLSPEECCGWWGSVSIGDVRGLTDRTEYIVNFNQNSIRSTLNNRVRLWRKRHIRLPLFLLTRLVYSEFN